MINAAKEKTVILLEANINCIYISILYYNL